jgi:uncharacterized protein (TIGR04255 family)
MSWQPAREQHAIERVAFTALLGFPLPPKPFERLLTSVRRRAADSGINEMVVLPQPVQIQLTAQDPKISGFQLTPPAEFGPLGQAYRKTDDGRVLEEIICHNNIIVFSATKYRHWTDFLSRLELCLSEAIKSISQLTNILEVRLEYWDRFDQRAPATEGNSEEDHLINPRSTLVAPFQYGQTGSWHSHIGFFLGEGTAVRTLVNANIDVVSNSPGLPPVLIEGISGQARIYTLVTAQHTVPNSGFDDWQTVKDALDSRHELSKSIVGDLIHPRLADQIQLSARPLDL